MAVKAIRERPQGRTGGVDAKWNRTYKRIFEVQTDNVRDGVFTVLGALAAAGVKVGRGYDNGLEQDAGAVCRSIAPQCESADGLQWAVDVEYGPWEPATENPLDQPPEVDWDFAQFEAIAEVDVDGNPIVNTAGDPFDPPPMKDDSRPVLTIVRNEPHFSPSLAYSYRDTLNETDFYGAPPGTVKAIPPKGKRAWHANVLGGYYWIVTYQFHFNPDGWDKQILNQGLMQIDGGEKAHILEKGLPTSNPVPLGRDGKALTPADDPIFLTFPVYKRKDFFALNLGG